MWQVVSRFLIVANTIHAVSSDSRLMRNLQSSSSCDYVFSCPNKCSGDVCSCEDEYENRNCNVCHNGQGCSQCEYGYVKIDNNYPCVECESVFGDGCLHCSDYNGCNQCSDGYEMVKDNYCGNGVNYCKPKDCNNPTPRPTSWNQPIPRPTWKNTPRPTLRPTWDTPNPTPKPSPRPTWDTPNPTRRPTPRPTSSPTPAPTQEACDIDFNQAVIYVISNGCKLNEYECDVAKTFLRDLIERTYNSYYVDMGVFTHGIMNDADLFTDGKNGGRDELLSFVDNLECSGDLQETSFGDSLNDAINELLPLYIFGKKVVLINLCILGDENGLEICKNIPNGNGNKNPEIFVINAGNARGDELSCAINNDKSVISISGGFDLDKLLSYGDEIEEHVCSRPITPNPTPRPTPRPTAQPTSSPTRNPTPRPTWDPTPQPTKRPTPKPTTWNGDSGSQSDSSSGNKSSSGSSGSDKSSSGGKSASGSKNNSGSSSSSGNKWNTGSNSGSESKSGSGSGSKSGSSNSGDGGYTWTGNSGSTSGKGSSASKSSSGSSSTNWFGH